MESSPLKWHSSGRLGQAGKACIYLIGCESIKGLVRTLAVVEFKAQRDATSSVGHGLVRLQVRVLVFEATPKRLDKHVIQTSTLPCMLIWIPLAAVKVGSPVKSELRASSQSCARTSA